MDRRIDAGGLLVAAASALLVVSLFLRWFGLPDTGGVTGWQAFEVLDLVLLAAAAAAVAAAFGRLGTPVLLGATAVAVLVVVSQLIQPPPLAQAAGVDRDIGVWLALVAVAGLAAGAALVVAQIAVTVDVKGRERRPRVAAVDRRGAAAAAAEPVAGPDPSAATTAAGDGFERPAPAEDVTRSDGFARPSASDPEIVGDPQATQAFQLPPEPPEPK